MRRIYPFFLVFCLFAGSFAASAQNLGVKLEKVADSFNKPVFVSHYPKDSSKMVVVEEEGRVVIVEDGTVVENPPFCDARSKVDSSGGRGLVSIAFHPKFSTNSKFYLNYASKDTGSLAVYEYEVSRDNVYVGDLSRGRMVYSLRYPRDDGSGFGRDFNFGQIAFGPDAMLYIAIGDDGAPGDKNDHGQNVLTPFGALLRIDVDLGSREEGQQFLVPPDNPFFKYSKALPEIWAYGFKAPRRFSFDRETGDVWLGDSGLSLFEEINLVRAGGNYGWSVFSADSCLRLKFECLDSRYISPVFSYPRKEGKSVRGGFVYRGKRFPKAQGLYVYGDYSSGKIWVLRHDQGKVTSNKLLLDTDLRISSFGEDLNGELYVLGMSKGVLYKILFESR